MVGLDLLRRRFALPEMLTFDEHNGLIRLNIHTPQATATLYLQGAHLTAWKPAGQQPVIFVSRNSEYAPGKPIRGGVPIVFPWFAGDRKRDRIDGHPGPSHGFARIDDWTLTSVRYSAGELRLGLDLGPSALSRSLGFDRFLLRLEVRIGKTLNMALTITNRGDKPLVFEEAFHTYFSITDIHEVSLSGLEPADYFDKTDAMKRMPATHEPIRFSATTNRIYAGSTADCTIHDGAGSRRIVLHKTNSKTTVVWTPWDKLPELAAWEWHEMLAVETANLACCEAIAGGIDCGTSSARVSSTFARGQPPSHRSNSAFTDASARPAYPSRCRQLWEALPRFLRLKTRAQGDTLPSS